MERNLIQPAKATWFMTGPSFEEVAHASCYNVRQEDWAMTEIATRTGSERSVLSRATTPRTLHSSKPDSDEEHVLITTTEAEGFLDTWASRTVAGSKRVQDILHDLDAVCRAGVRKFGSDVVLNSATVAP